LISQKKFEKSVFFSNAKTLRFKPQAEKIASVVMYEKSEWQKQMGIKGSKQRKAGLEKVFSSKKRHYDGTSVS